MNERYGKKKDCGRDEFLCGLGVVLIMWSMIGLFILGMDQEAERRGITGNEYIVGVAR